MTVERFQSIILTLCRRNVTHLFTGEIKTIIAYKLHINRVSNKFCNKLSGKLIIKLFFMFDAIICFEDNFSSSFIFVSQSI